MYDDYFVVIKIFDFDFDFEDVSMRQIKHNVLVPFQFIEWLRYSFKAVIQLFIFLKVIFKYVRS